jgi:hypothetical protein
MFVFNAKWASAGALFHWAPSTLWRVPGFLLPSYRHGPVKEQTCFCTCYNLAPMPSIQSIVAELIQERDRISQAIAALESIDGSTRTAGHPNTGGASHEVKRIVSAVSRRRMAAAQKARWAKAKSSPSTKRKRHISPAGLARIRAAARARWAKVRAKQKKS